MVCSLSDTRLESQFLWQLLCTSMCARVCHDVYFEKIRVFKAGVRLNTLAWNNRIGLEFYFVGFRDLGND